MNTQREVARGLRDEIVEILAKGPIKRTEIERKTGRSTVAVRTALARLRDEGAAASTGWARSAVWALGKGAPARNEDERTMVVKRAEPAVEHTNGERKPTRWAPRRAAHVLTESKAPSPSLLGDLLGDEETLKTALRGFLQRRLASMINDLLEELEA